MAPILVTETSLALNNFHEHPLVRVEAAVNVHDQPYQEFICDGCNTPGSGSVDVRYRCNQCPFFDLHEVCATCPKKLSTHIHPKHQMVLVWRKPTSETNNLVLADCDVCGDEVKGLYYTCLQLEPPQEKNHSTSSCKGIVLHPICSKFPSHLQHVKDPHPLTFQKATASSCTICDEICDSWRYRCETCKTNIHPECVGIPCHDPTVLVDKSAKPATQQPQPQQPSPPSEIPYCIPAPYPMQQQQQQQYYCHQEKRPAADSPSPNSGYPRPQQPVPMHQQWPPNNNYGAYYPPPPMHHPHHHPQYYCHQEKRPAADSPSPNSGYPQPQQPVPMHQQWPPNNNYGAYYPPPPMHYPHHPQYFYPPYPYYPYNTYLQQPATAAAYQAGGGGASSSGGSKKKRRMYLVVGRIVATLAFTAVFGIPIPF